MIISYIPALSGHHKKIVTTHRQQQKTELYEKNNFIYAHIA
jgi:hypothetical protein